MFRFDFYHAEYADDAPTPPLRVMLIDDAMPLDEYLLLSAIRHGATAQRPDFT